MKINVTVDVSEFYAEEEGENFGDAIKNHIAHQVKTEIWAKFKEDAMTSFDNQIKRQIDLDKDIKIKETIDDLFKNKAVKKKYSNNEVVPFNDYIEDYFVSQSVNSNDFMNKVNNEIKKQAETIVKQLKDRYDLLFASQIVQKLNENGMLREDVARLLLPKDPNV